MIPKNGTETIMLFPLFPLYSLFVPKDCEKDV